MTDNVVHKVLSRYVDIRPEETSSSVYMFLYFFLITTSIYIIKPVKVSLFLQRLEFSRLPYAYLLTALLMGFVVALNQRLLSVIRRQLYVSFSLIFFISNLFLFWFLFKIQWPWISLIYWFWSELFVVTSVTQFWIFVNDIYNPRQVRRLIGFLVSGGILGGIAGSFLASFLSRKVGTENLLLICPFMLLGCLALVVYVHLPSQGEKDEEIKVRRGQMKPKTGYRESFHLLIKNRHLLLLSGIVLTAIVVTTLIDFQFNSVVDKTFKDLKDERTAFLGTFFTLLLICSYFINILLTNRILKNFGIRIALLIAPFFLLIGSLTVFFIPAYFLIYWAVLIKGSDKSLSHTLSQSVRELLYIPISPEIKYRAKVFIDMFVNKLAEGLGALLLLLPLAFKEISILVIIFILAWAIFNVLITKEYVNIVKRNLKIKWQDADKFISEKIDVDMTKLVFDTLQSKKRSSVLYAMNLFDLFKKKRLSPELKKIVSYKSDEIRARSLDSLLGMDGEVLMPEVDDSLEDEDLNAQVKEIMSLGVYQRLMEEHLDSVISLEGRGAEVSRMEAAKVMGMMEPTQFLIQKMNKLLKDESPEVIRYAVESAGKLRRRESVPLIIQHLKKPSTQEIAGRVLVEYGSKIAGTLKDYLADQEEDIQLRLAIPDILARIGTQRAADLLALELKKGNKDVEPEIIEAMYKLKSKNPQVHFQERLVLSKIILRIKESYIILMEIYGLIFDKKKEFLAKDLENNLAQSLKHIFELLSLVYAQEDMTKAYQNICTGSKKSIDYSIELLENTLKKEIMEFLLPVIDDIPLEDKVKKCKKMLKSLEKLELS